MPLIAFRAASLPRYRPNHSGSASLTWFLRRDKAPRRSRSVNFLAYLSLIRRHAAESGHHRRIARRLKYEHVVLPSATSLPSRLALAIREDKRLS
jgi:hypothetical protein